MKKQHLYLMLPIFWAMFVSCEIKAETKSYNEGINIVPEPQSITQQEGKFILTSHS
ncbi:MAG: hypothetical protein RR319_09215 [Bacteroides sp.]